MRPFGLMTGVFGCTRSATDPRRAAVGELLSGGTGERNPITVTSDPGLRFRVVDALADLVEELALAGSLVIGVDDLQWAGRLLAEQASSLMWAGRVARAEEVCRALLERDHDPATEGAARICLGYALMASGRPQDGLAELERAASSPLLTGTERSGALGWASIARMWLGDLDGCEATAEEAGAAAGESGDHMTITIASSMSAIVSLYHGRLGRAAELIDGAGGRPSQPAPGGAPLPGPRRPRLRPDRAGPPGRRQGHARGRQPDRRGTRPRLAWQLPRAQHRAVLRGRAVGRGGHGGRGERRAGRRDRRELRAPGRPQRAGADQPAPQRHRAGRGGHRRVLRGHHPLPLAVGAVGARPHPGGRRQDRRGLRDAGRLLGPVRRTGPGAGVPKACRIRR